MYDPAELKKEYEKLEHGRARMAGIRYAIAEADKNNDYPFMFFFRAQECRESCFYGDALEMYVRFPELLSLADKYPDTPTTAYDSGFRNSVDHVLWIYKWILGSLNDYYQIPFEDCERYFEDFKRRSLAYGYNLKPYYLNRYYFYQYIDRAYADECFYEYEKIPWDRENCDCRACERNVQISFYLDKDDIERANALAKDIESFKLRCGQRMDAWMRLKKHYMNHWENKEDYDKAVFFCGQILRQKNDLSEFDIWDNAMCIYSHVDIGKALRIYKAHWKDWQKQRKPSDIFYTSLNAAIFFVELKKVRKGNTVKLPLDRGFPLYREDGKYKIEELIRYYCMKADEIGKKFDARNRSDFFQRELEDYGMGIYTGGLKALPPV